jgi:hypothetical protein
MCLEAMRHSTDVFVLVDSGLVVVAFFLVEVVVVQQALVRLP